MYNNQAKYIKNFYSLIFSFQLKSVTIDYVKILLSQPFDVN